MQQAHRKAVPFVVIDTADGAKIGAPVTREQIGDMQRRGESTPFDAAAALNVRAGYERFAVVPSIGRR